ncbi:hypothetical protein B0H66DRAFT_527339 [Apodospora peruviana]|uniref:Uncharacterized protein n=1 Tax=Apodospora peruviana TaxID=516989 RepID=A0AAE0MEU8_9PEZI|nr:hypothetical protein B0H66DRAFT_527339 [Apodospora peruviana]
MITPPPTTSSAYTSSFTEVSTRTSPRLDRIKENYRRVLDKLTTLEGAITGTKGDKTAAAGTYTPWKFKERIPFEHADYKPVSVVVTGQCAGRRRTSKQPYPEGLRGHSKLAKKFLLIGNEEARIQVAEFTAQLNSREPQNTLPNAHRFSKVSRITEKSAFMRLLLNLGLAIESGVFGEQNSRLRKRIALAHFYHAYTLAQDNPELFLSWYDDQRGGGDSMLLKGGIRSVVQYLFAELGAEVPLVAPRPFDKADDAKMEDCKGTDVEEDWQEMGAVMQRFGCVILLLLPSSLSDEDLRVAHDKAVACGLDLIDSRKHLFADVLQQANDLLNAHFSP